MRVRRLHRVEPEAAVAAGYAEVRLRSRRGFRLVRLRQQDYAARRQRCPRRGIDASADDRAGQRLGGHARDRVAAIDLRTGNQASVVRNRRRQRRLRRPQCQHYRDTAPTQRRHDAHLRLRPHGDRSQPRTVNRADPAGPQECGERTGPSTATTFVQAIPQQSQAALQARVHGVDRHREAPGDHPRSAVLPVPQHDHGAIGLGQFVHRESHPLHGLGGGDRLVGRRHGGFAGCLALPGQPADGAASAHERQPAADAEQPRGERTAWRRTLHGRDVGVLHEVVRGRILEQPPPDRTQRRRLLEQALGRALQICLAANRHARSLPQPTNLMQESARTTETGGS